MFPNNIRKLSFKKSAGLDYIRDAEKNFLEYGQVEEVGIKAPLEIIGNDENFPFPWDQDKLIGKIYNKKSFTKYSALAWYIFK